MSLARVYVTENTVVIAVFLCGQQEDVLPQGHYYDLRRWKSRGVDVMSFIYQVEGCVVLMTEISALVAQLQSVIYILCVYTCAGISVGLALCMV
jgi:ABC-type spermidine/putrescine transport system permease subunit II